LDTTGLLACSAEAVVAEGSAKDRDRDSDRNTLKKAIERADWSEKPTRRSIGITDGVAALDVPLDICAAVGSGSGNQHVCRDCSSHGGEREDGGSERETHFGDMERLVGRKNCN